MMIANLMSYTNSKKTTIKFVQMKKDTVLIGLILFGLGIIGVLSMLTMEIPLTPEIEEVLKERFTAQQIKMLLLINPTVLLLIAVVIGTAFYQKVNLHVPLIEKMVGNENHNFSTADILKFGILGGILSGVLLSLVGFIFTPMLPAEFLELGKSLKPTLAARFLYGGITEEIMMRFGLMTLIVWIVATVLNNTKPIAYWSGIVIASIVFGLGHFPIAYQTVGNPSAILLAYVLIGNTVGGLVFGWLYWKKGLESAFLAHIVTHVIMIIAEPILN